MAEPTESEQVELEARRARKAGTTGGTPNPQEPETPTPPPVTGQRQQPKRNQPRRATAKPSRSWTRCSEAYSLGSYLKEIPSRMR